MRPRLSSLGSRLGSAGRPEDRTLTRETALSRSRLGALGPGDAAWFEVGRVVRRFHEAGVVHADLNARNILLDDDGRLHVLDFDRATVAPRSRRRFRANLERLHRSLVKVWPAEQAATLEACWRRVREGYEAVPQAS